MNQINKNDCQIVRRKFGVKTARKVFLMDMTTESITMTVWHADYQERMDRWQPLETVLHLIDVRIDFSKFERSTVLSVTSKTIIIENPVPSSRSNDIMAYIHQLSLEKINELKNIRPKSSIDCGTIKDAMTVKRILDEIERDPSKDITAIVHGVITKFDINGALVKSCVHCKRLFARNRGECTSTNCDAIPTDGPRYVDKVYMAISISDHSGTLNGRITDEYAKGTLGYNAQELKQLAEDDIDAIFNRFILERQSIKMIVRPKSQTEYFASIVCIETLISDKVALSLKP